MRLAHWSCVSGVLRSVVRGEPSNIYKCKPSRPYFPVTRFTTFSESQKLRTTTNVIVQLHTVNELVNLWSYVGYIRFVMALINSTSKTLFNQPPQSLMVRLVSGQYLRCSIPSRQRLRANGTGRSHGCNGWFRGGFCKLYTREPVESDFSSYM
jgi:hypothetical protein